jgi:hypothetical protein
MRPMSAVPAQQTWCGFVVDESFADRADDLVDERDWPWLFETSEEVWIHQTMLRLADAGYPVRPCSLVDAASCEVVVVHPGRVRQLVRTLGRTTSTRVLLASSDKTYGRRFADLSAIQHLRIDGSRQVHVPHWPQPGLLRRDATDHRVARAEFKGDPATLHRDLRGASWSSELDALGITWHISPRPSPSGTTTDRGPHPWSDYRRTDVIVAIRGETNKLHNKPASKLVNAWRAGVPAVLGPEPAFRELRCCDLDYIEAETAADALRALERLQIEPRLYSAMVEHGLRRARDFEVDVVRAAWVQAICRARQTPKRPRVLTIGSIRLSELISTTPWRQSGGHEPE